MELLIDYEKSVKAFLLEELANPSKPTFKREKIVEVASEYLSSAVKYAEDLTDFQSELQP